MTKVKPLHPTQYVVLFFISLMSSFNGVQSQERYEERKNILKASLTSLAFRNYQFQAERVLTRAISISFTYANIPQGDVPFKDKVLNLLEEPDEATVNMLNSAQVGYTSYIPEVRFYLGKGYGKGVYLSAFYKYSKYTIENAKILEYERNDGSFEDLITDGDVSANTFGVLLGAQFNLGKRFLLDWWILGPNIGTHKGDLIGTPNSPLTFFEQEMLKEDLEDIEIPLTETSFNISSEVVEMKTKGAWGGIRAGICFAFRF